MKIFYNGTKYEPNHFRMILQLRGEDDELEAFDKFVYVCNAYGWEFDVDGEGIPWKEDAFLVREVASMYDNLMSV